MVWGSYVSQLREEIKQKAELAVAQMQGGTSRPLDYSEASLSAVEELLGEAGGGVEIGNPENLVVAALEANAVLLQLSTQPLPTIDANLGRVRRPCLDAHMHPTEPGRSDFGFALKKTSRNP